MAAGNSAMSETASVISAESNSSSSTTPGPRKTTLGRRMGGWVLGKWGTAPVSSEAGENESTEPTASDLTHDQEVDNSIPKPQTVSTPKHVDTPASTTYSLSSTPNPNSTPQFRFRFTGVNQKGPILGFRPPPRAPVSIHPQGVDENLLRESLADG
ncbi:hypothetical protein N7450_010119 [Penicillium hetheringtonii]|uniref:Uncharacterized protein n=1 Tax=Penicillium hetheringtonii TaxID=911720 RepID=A0AAD6DEB7_9EURO|nr:hypothetical protein N7450_010119 [Penicillium hetheringtonii]